MEMETIYHLGRGSGRAENIEFGHTFAKIYSIDNNVLNS